MLLELLMQAKRQQILQFWGAFFWRFEICLQKFSIQSHQTKHPNTHNIQYGNSVGRPVDEST